MSVIEPHIHELYFDSRGLSYYGLHVSGNESYRSPEKDYETVEVPGRSGDLHFDLGRFKNVTISYPAFIGENLETNLNGLMGYLLSRKGYCELKDTYHPDYYRLAEYKGPLDPEIILLQAGTFTLEFDCKPQKFLESGRDSIRVKANGSATLTNVSEFTAYPLISVVGNGSFEIKNTTVTVTDNDSGRVDIDFDLMDCVKVVGNTRTNHNSKVTFSGAEFDGLPHGPSNVKANSNITLTIYPRWWTL